MRGCGTLLLVGVSLCVGSGTARAELPRLDTLKECKDSLDVAIFNSPRRAHRGAPLRVMITSEHELDDVEVAALKPSGDLVKVDFKRYGGPPWGWVVEIEKPSLGTWTFGIGNGARVDACQRVRVRRTGAGRNQVEEGEVVDPIWKSRIKWERDTENLFSLWVETLFDAPLDEDLSWNPFHLVTRDPKRNLLYNHLGIREDRGGKDGIRMKPDCADFPYFLRAYFAWKMGLPFGYRGCRRGNAKRAPRCGDMVTNLQTSEFATHTEAFAYFIRRKVGGTVHSSSPRTLPLDEASDFYPVKLTRKSLRPGTIYADPYGHTLLVGKWIPGTDEKAGTLLAVDAQPDGTIGRRVFWKGSFLFPEDDAIKGAGFKRFRPVKRVAAGNEAFSNEMIQKSIDYGDFSTEQWDRGKDAFYERMDEVITPQPLPPKAAFMAYIDALDQQIRRRVESIENGEGWKRKNPRRVMSMPEGPAIFITSGPWESYSTPSRDLRLLIAMDTVRNYPERLKSRPKRFKLAAGETVESAYQSLRELLRTEAQRRSFSYRRSDGSPKTLSMADIMSREKAFEMAYNPNDCIEVRWGAPEGSDERSTCENRAPQDHLERMETYRPWFQKRVRPLH